MPPEITVADLMERACDELRPFGAQLELTYKCNLLCSFCYNTPKERKELDGDQWISALDKLKAAGVFRITLTGGEPFCHRDFFRIGAAVRERGFVLVTYTNGLLLADRERVARYAELSPFDTEISLHGADAPTHERLTGIRGSFDKLMTALRNMSNLGLKATVKTPITKLNQGQLAAIEKLVAQFGYKVTFDTNITPTDDGDLGPLSLAPEKKYLIEFFARRMNGGAANLGPRVLEKTKQSCGTGRTTVTIDPYGDMFPCVAWRRRIANIMEVEDFAALWQGRNGPANETLAFVRKVAEEVPMTTLAVNEGGAFAMFCPAVAERETGSPYGYYNAARASGLARLEAYQDVQRERAMEKNIAEPLAPKPDPA